MDEQNPFASPRSYEPSAAVDPQQCQWRDGRLLVVRRSTPLIERCVFCNEPCDIQVVISATNIRPVWKPLVSVGLAVGDSIVWGEKTSIPLGVCTQHRRFYARRAFRQRIVEAVGYLLMIASAFLMTVSGLLTIAIVLLIGIAMLVNTWLGRPPLEWTKCDGQFVWVKGISPRYLEDLPAWVQP